MSSWLWNSPPRNVASRCDEIAGQILAQADAAALRRVVQISRDGGLGIAVRQEVRREIRRRAAQVDVLDATGILGLCRIGKFELVEDIARHARIVVRIPET